MRIILCWLCLVAPAMVHAQNDIRDRVEVKDAEKIPPATRIIDITKHIFGHLYGTTEDQFIQKEGKPDGYLSLAGGRTVMIYGKSVGFIFTQSKLTGVKISTGIVDWKLANEMRSKSRFDDIRWRLKQGIVEDMDRTEVRKLLGENIIGKKDYEDTVAFGDLRMVISYASSMSRGGEKSFMVHGIYLTKDE